MCAVVVVVGGGGGGGVWVCVCVCVRACVRACVRVIAYLHVRGKPVKFAKAALATSRTLLWFQTA